MRISEATITYLIQNWKLQQPQPQPSQMPQYDSTTDSDSVEQGQSLLLYRKQDIKRTIMIPRLGRSFCTFKCYLCSITHDIFAQVTLKFEDTAIVGSLLLLIQYPI